MAIQQRSNWQQIYDRVVALEAELRQVRMLLMAMQPAAGEAALSETKRRAIAAAGRFHSGLADLSSDHDRYLLEAYRG